MSERLQGTESAALAIQRVSFTHDALIDLHIANPALSQGDLAKHFGYTQAWISRVMNSDAFLERLALRKQDIVDPVLSMSVDEKLRALASQSLDILHEKMAITRNPDTALKALDVATKALGYGARQQNLNVQQNFVVQMPEKAATVEGWAAKHAGGGMSAGSIRVDAGQLEKIQQQSPGLMAMAGMAHAVMQPPGGEVEDATEIFVKQGATA